MDMIVASASKAVTLVDVGTLIFAGIAAAAAGFGAVIEWRERIYRRGSDAARDLYQRKEILDAVADKADALVKAFEQWTSSQDEPAHDKAEAAQQAFAEVTRKGWMTHWIRAHSMGLAILVNDGLKPGSDFSATLTEVQEKYRTFLMSIGEAADVVGA